VDGREHRGAEGRNLVSVPERSGERARLAPVAGLSRSAAIDHLSTTYGWDPRRVDAAILKLADYFKSTNEVYYPDPSDHHQVVVVWIRRTGRTYEISEEKRAARLARPDAVRYSKRVPNGKAAPVRPVPNRPTLEAIPMATRTAAKRPTRAKAKPAPEPEPEEVEEELEELEDEAEVDEDAEDEAEVDEDEDEEQDEDEDAEDAEDDTEDEVEEEEVEDEAEDEPAEEDERDYRIYAEKPITATMEDFAEWLEQEVAPLDSMDPIRLVALAGTLRMEFQKSQFCKDRREERRNAARVAKAPKPKAEPPAKATKTKAAAPAAKPAPAKAKAAAPAAKPAAAKVPAQAARKTGAAAGRPAPRTADRPTARKPTTRRGKAADTKEAPF
jgi:hypothetical protein